MAKHFDYKTADMFTGAGQMKPKKKLILKYKTLRADLAAHLPNLTVEEFLALNRASVTIRRIEREMEPQEAPDSVLEAGRDEHLSQKENELGPEN